MGSERSKAVLITGCSSGIGQATALRLAKGGWTVYATARRTDALEPLRSEGCHALALDLTDEGSMRTAVETLEREHGAVGALVNNAGYSQSGALEELGAEQLRRQFETNVFGLLRLTQLVLPGMRARRWGRIVNIGSIGGRMTFPGGGAYHATKHALEALSDALRFEVRGFGVDVALVQPGFIRTGFARTAVESVGAAAGSDGPYAAFNQAVIRNTEEAYVKPPYTWLGGEPDDVARVVAKILTARRPRARYAVTPSAWMLLWMRRWLPDCLWEAFLRMQFPQPGTP